MKTISTICSTLLLALFSHLANAEIQLTTTAEVEVTGTDSQGKETVSRQPADRVVPGSEVIYTITAKNTGNEPADNIVVTNPVPANTVYVEGSAFGSGTEITFSVDGGKRYGKPGELTVTTTDDETRSATAQDYTHIRWNFRFELQPGKEAPVWYRVRVK